MTKFAIFSIRELAFIFKVWSYNKYVITAAKEIWDSLACWYGAKNYHPLILLRSITFLKFDGSDDISRNQTLDNSKFSCAAAGSILLNHLWVFSVELSMLLRCSSESFYPGLSFSSTTRHLQRVSTLFCWADIFFHMNTTKVLWPRIASKMSNHLVQRILRALP